MPLTDSPTTPRRWSSWGAVGLALGGLGAAFAAAACCALPILLGGLGLGTAWLFGIAKVAAPHRLAWIAIALLLIATAAVALWRSRRSVCATSGWCSRPAVRWLTGATLGVAALLAVLGYRYG